MFFKFIPDQNQGKQDLKMAYIQACICLIVITFIDQGLPARVRLDALYVCFVVLIVGQPLKRIIVYSLPACFLILAAHLKMNARIRLSWINVVNAGISIIAA